MIAKGNMSSEVVCALRSQSEKTHWIEGRMETPCRRAKCET